MRFVSTRGGAAPPASLEDAIRRGYAPDGGLYVPEALPPISEADLAAWGALDYAGVAKEVLWPFAAGEIDRAAFDALIAASYAGAAAPDVVPVRKLNDAAALVELYHGPTHCFKDLGLQVAVRLLAHFAQRRGAPATLVVATTGDTGPAALRAVADVGDASTRIVVCFPRGMVSELQRRQMTCCDAENVRVVSFEGGGDDMDAPLKNLAMDSTFADARGLCGVNSYNIARPLAQQVHYVWAYLRCRELFGAETPLDVVVPTGAMGNLAAATFAKRRGVPLGILCAATNANDISYRAIAKGDFSKDDAMKKTVSDAINVQVPYNFERVLYYALNENSKAVAAAFASFEANGDAWTLDAAARAGLSDYRAARVDDATTLASIRRCVDAHSVVCDPHAAVALAGAEALGYGAFGGAAAALRPVAILATAHACKFEEAVGEALGADAWAAFRASPAFPAAARALEDEEEVPPLHLARRRGEALEAAQARWEASLRALLEDPDGLHAVIAECGVASDDEDAVIAERGAASDDEDGVDEERAELKRLDARLRLLKGPDTKVRELQARRAALRRIVAGEPEPEPEPAAPEEGYCLLM